MAAFCVRIFSICHVLWSLYRGKADVAVRLMTWCSGRGKALRRRTKWLSSMEVQCILPDDEVLFRAQDGVTSTWRHLAMYRWTVGDVTLTGGSHACSSFGQGRKELCEGVTCGMRAVKLKLGSSAVTRTWSLDSDTWDWTISVLVGLCRQIVGV